jgi:hypothetical protein
MDTPYIDSPAARRRFAGALIASAGNKRLKLSLHDRDELRRIADLWETTLPEVQPQTAQITPNKQNIFIS